MTSICTRNNRSHAPTAYCLCVGPQIYHAFCKHEQRATHKRRAGKPEGILQACKCARGRILCVCSPGRSHGSPPQRLCSSARGCRCARGALGSQACKMRQTIHPVTLTRGCFTGWRRCSAWDAADVQQILQFERTAGGGGSNGGGSCSGAVAQAERTGAIVTDFVASAGVRLRAEPAKNAPKAHRSCSGHQRPGPRSQ